MTARYGNEMGTYVARRRKVITLRRPLIIGALAAGVIALGASTAVAAGPLGRPSPETSAVCGHGASASMMSGSSMATMHRASASMMSGTSMRTMHRTSASMMSGTSMATPPATSTGMATSMMSGTSTGAMPS